MKKLGALISIGGILFSISAFANNSDSFGQILQPRIDGVTSAASIDFDSSWGSASLTSAWYTFYSDANCTTFRSNAQSSSPFSAFTPAANSHYNVNGSNLYALISISYNPTLIQSFSFWLGNSSGGGTTGDSGSATCACLSISCSGGECTGSSTTTVAYNSSNHCQTPT